MNNITTLVTEEISYIAGAGDNLDAGREVGNQVGEKIEETIEYIGGFIVGVYDAFTNGR